MMTDELERTTCDNLFYNHSVLPMSLFIDSTFRLLNREAFSEQFLAVLPLQLQKDK